MNPSSNSPLPATQWYGFRLSSLGQHGPELHGDLGAVRCEQQALDVLRAHARHMEMTLEGVKCQQAVVRPVREPLGGGARVLLPLAGAEAQYRLEIAFLVCPERRRHDQGDPERGIETQFARLRPEDVGFVQQLVEFPKYSSSVGARSS
jgi:hypothetical protein